MKPLITCILFLCILTGCKKNILDLILFKNNFQCNINGRDCCLDDRNSGLNGNITYTYNEETKKTICDFKIM